MARFVCPSCGGAFNGRKCRACLYEQFDEEISHRLHTHKGEPLVVTNPRQRPRARRDPLSWDKRTRKKQKKAGSLVWFLLLFALNPLLELGELLIDSGTELVSSVISQETAAPEPELPPDACILWESGVYTLWGREGEDPQAGSLTVFLENRSGRAVTVASGQVVVNDFLSEGSMLYCEAPADARAVGYLNLDEDDLSLGRIQEISSLSLKLELYDSETYDSILETDLFPLLAGENPGRPEPEGEPVAQGEGWQVRYLGYEPDGYDPETFSEGSLLFYLENNTSEELTFYTEAASLNGERASLVLWTELPPGCRTVTRMHLYGAADAGITSVEQVSDLKLTLGILSGAEEAWTAEITLEDW